MVSSSVPLVYAQILWIKTLHMKLPVELQFIANARMPQKSTVSRMDGRICVITGTTSGVGYAAVKRLAQGGARIVMICRNKEKAIRVQTELKDSFNAQTDIVIADFTRLTDVRRATKSLLDRYPRIDVLINNAGVHNTRCLTTTEGFETVFCVNHLASFLLTRLLLDRLKASAPSRIIQISSQGHRFGGLDLSDLNWERRRYKGTKGYGASKIAQLLTVWEFADQLAGSGVTINAVHPGEVKTNIGMNNGALYRWYNQHILRPFLKDPEISGEVIYYFAAAPEMANVSGKFFNLTIAEQPAAHALNRSTGKQVWAISERFTGLNNSD